MVKSLTSFSNEILSSLGVSGATYAEQAKHADVRDKAVFSRYRCAGRLVYNNENHYLRAEDLQKAPTSQDPHDGRSELRPCRKRQSCDGKHGRSLNRVKQHSNRILKWISKKIGEADNQPKEKAVIIAERRLMETYEATKKDSFQCFRARTRKSLERQRKAWKGRRDRQVPPWKGLTIPKAGSLSDAAQCEILSAWARLCHPKSQRALGGTALQRKP